MATRERLSVSVDPVHVQAGRAAVAAGRAESLSAWVNAALRSQAATERQLARLDAFFAAYEAEDGEISEEERVAARRHFKERAIVVRGGIVERHGSAGPT